MLENKKPVGLLFDIGGVCVVSPFQAILDYEIANNIPKGWVNFSISRTSPNGSWHRLERGEIKLDADFFKASMRDCRRSKHPGVPISAPPLPEIDAEWLFWEMMRVSRTPDPYMYPALQKLKASGQFIIGALSNTVIFPDGHPYNSDSNGVKSQFDFFISSAHTGLRKPDPKIYAAALREMDTLAKKRGLQGVEPSDVVFLDDIGENLKAAKNAGLRTIKVNLGRTQDAIRELEKITGLQLLDTGDKAKL
ncbi:epoxide hydrolase, putative [Aspergillus fumigatus A1163]|uniref:Epoxide hydrolase, putative n=1 Tax=Aspergillus fumigatus (strain CBS 144.89 / FGSC A1163 / CEA10) TaxID=451804 RepID=B0XR74_ASPFC|nr:epoxide hydrolase, putative [Aspergillus fumigatus A1163]